MERPPYRTDRLPFLVDSERRGVVLRRIELSDQLIQEEWIQEVLRGNPSLLPFHDTEWAFRDPICIGREVNTGVGPLDNLYISQRGRLTVVECKLYRNPESRRKVVGQILDYAAQLRSWTYEKLDSICRSYNQIHRSSNDGLFETAAKEFDLPPEAEVDFVDSVNKGLREGHFLLMILGDGIRTGLEEIVELVRGKADLSFTLALAELQLYELGDGRRLIVPYLLQRTETIVQRLAVRVDGKSDVRVSSLEPLQVPQIPDSGDAKPSGTQRRRLDEEEFLALLPDGQEQAAREFIQCMKDTDVRIIPRSAGLSFRIQNRITGGTDFGLFVLTTDGQLYPRSLIRQLRQSGVDPQLGVRFIQDTAALFEGVEPRGLESAEETDLTRNWSRTVTLDEVAPRKQDLVAAVKWLIRQLAPFEQDA